MTDPQPTTSPENGVQNLSDFQLLTRVFSEINQPAIDGITKFLRQALLLLMHDQELSFQQAQAKLATTIAGIPDTTVFDVNDDGYDGSEHSVIGYIERAVIDASNVGSFSVVDAKRFINLLVEDFPVRLLLSEKGDSVTHAACFNIRKLLYIQKPRPGSDIREPLLVETPQFGTVQIKSVSAREYQVSVAGKYAPVLCAGTVSAEDTDIPEVVFRLLVDSDLMIVTGIPYEQAVQALERVLFAASQTPEL